MNLRWTAWENFPKGHSKSFPNLSSSNNLAPSAQWSDEGLMGNKLVAGSSSTGNMSNRNFVLFQCNLNWKGKSFAQSKYITSLQTPISFRKSLNLCSMIWRMRNPSLYSSVAERQSCKLKLLGSIPSEGCWTSKAMANRNSKISLSLFFEGLTSNSVHQVRGMISMLVRFPRWICSRKQNIQTKGTPGFEPEAADLQSAASAIELCTHSSLVILSN